MLLINRDIIISVKGSNINIKKNTKVLQANNF